MSSKEIFGGDRSVRMWHEINTATTVDDLRSALYTVCCRLQEFESMVRQQQEAAIKLLPCPFCGHPAELRKDDVFWSAVCQNIDCRIKGPRDLDTDGATKSWNVRNAVPVPTSTLAQNKTAR